MDEFMEVYKEYPTVKDAENFDCEKDAEALRSAMKGMGCKKDKIVEILPCRSAKQRIEIAAKYQQMFGRELHKDLKSELSGNLEDLMVALVMPLHQYLAYELHEAMKGVGTNEKTLIEILCTRDNDDIKLIKEEYQKAFKCDLVKRLKDDTSGHFQKLMVSMATANRVENICDVAKATAVAQELYDAGEKKKGTDESVFNRVMSNYSRPFLICVFAEYLQLSGHSFDVALKKEMSGDLLDGMMALYLSVQNRPAYFAQRLYEAMKGVGTNNRTLIRLIVTRSEIDLVNIKEEYELLYKKTLVEHVSKEASGEYKKALLSLLG